MSRPDVQEMHRRLHVQMVALGLLVLVAVATVVLAGLFATVWWSFLLVPAVGLSTWTHVRTGRQIRRVNLETARIRAGTRAARQWEAWLR